MSDTSSTQLARRWFNDVWNDRREATIHELLHPDAIGHLEGVDVRGVEEFLQMRAALLEAFPDMRVNVESTIAEGDDVVLRWTASGTHRGAGLGFDATHRPVAFRGITWLRFANGQLVEGWDSWNQGGLIASLQAPG